MGKYFWYYTCRMTPEHPIEIAIQRVGLSRLARGLGLTAPAIRKWQRAGRLPRTEWTGETAYARKISQLCGGNPTVGQLKGPWPNDQVEANSVSDESGIEAQSTATQ